MDDNQLYAIKIIKKMKIFVTGLCLQGNKGGPAIALAMMGQIKRFLPEATFTFSVPSGEEFQYERPWSKQYGVDIVEDYSLKDLLPPYILRDAFARHRRVKSWFNNLREADLVIEMSAISYVGYPIDSIRTALLGGRFRYFISALVLKKKFLAWTQSYGPLSPGMIRLLARLDLKRQPIIFCRGEDCLIEIKGLLPKKKAFTFPDVATVLHYNRDWGINYIASIIEDLNPVKIVTISPSAVMFRKTNSSGESNKHITDLVSLCSSLLKKGYFILLVPHTFRPNRCKPEICDYAVALRVLDRFPHEQHIYVVREDLSPMDLKSTISAAHIHVGARYHSIVASLSSGVPTLSLSWHAKYKDIMRMYSVEKYIYDGINNLETRKLIAMFSEIEKNRDTINRKLIKVQPEIQSKVEENSRMFADIINGRI